MLKRCRVSLRAAIVALVVAAIGALAHAADPLPVRIGFSMPLSGPLASNGKAVLLAYKMWEEETNAAGGLLGRKVELVYYDDQSNPTTVPGIYAKLLDVDHVDVVLGSYGTNLTAPALPTVMPTHKIFLSLFALAANEEFHYPNYFSMFPAGPDSIKDFSRGYFELAKGAGLKTVAIVSADTDFAKKAADGARENAKAMGFHIVYERSYPPATVDFSPIVRAVSATAPDFVYVASYPPDSVGILRAKSEIGLTTKMFGGGMVGPQYGALKMQLGELLNGVVNYDFYVPSPTLRFTGIDDFLHRYQERAAEGGVDPLGYFVPPFAYANLQVLAQAATSAGSLRGEDVAKHLHADEFNTVVGKVRYGADGEWVQPRILQVQYGGIAGNGLQQFKDPRTYTVLYPRELASGELQTH
jgi:branched-chain amino acid transport system substrate-binding protein